MHPGFFYVVVSRLPLPLGEVSAEQADGEGLRNKKRVIPSQFASARM